MFAEVRTQLQATGITGWYQVACRRGGAALSAIRLDFPVTGEGLGAQRSGGVEVTNLKPGKLEDVLANFMCLRVR